MNGFAHLGNGKVIENSYIAFKDGKIDLIADATLTKIDLRQFDTTIDISSRHVYPGFIAPNCILGLQEAEAIRATSDYAEVGEYNPHIRSLIAYNAESKILETIKVNGVLYTQSTPRGGIISGMSSVLATDGWNWEDAVIKIDDGIHLNFPHYRAQIHSESSLNETHYNEQIKSLRAFFEQASAYCKTANVDEKNLRFEAMKEVFNGHRNLYLHADDYKDILFAIPFLKEFKINNIVLVGGRDCYRLTKFLKENQVAVMLNRLHDLPHLSEADIDLIYKTPYLLHKDSVLFCLQNHGDMEAMNARNIPFLAGTAAAYGLTKEEALQSITLNAAKILKVDHLIGSIEIGKLASIIVSSGDVLDMKTSQIILAFVNGKKINLQNFQFDLYNKYNHKLQTK